MAGVWNSLYCRPLIIEPQNHLKIICVDFLDSCLMQMRGEHIVFGQNTLCPFELQEKRNSIYWFYDINSHRLVCRPSKNTMET